MVSCDGLHSARRAQDDHRSKGPRQLKGLIFAVRVLHGYLVRIQTRSAGRRAQRVFGVEKEQDESGPHDKAGNS